MYVPHLASYQARFHVHAALYNGGHIARAKTYGMQENNLSIATASSLHHHGIKIKLSPDVRNRGAKWKAMTITISPLTWNNRDWVHWPTAEARSTVAAVDWNGHESRETGGGWGSAARNSGGWGAAC